MNFRGKNQPLPVLTSAFTLLEIMIVVAVLGIVMTISYPALRGAIHRAPMTQAVVDITKGCTEARRRAVITGLPAELRFFQDGRIEVADSPVEQDLTITPVGEPTTPVMVDPDAPPKKNQLFSAQLSDAVAIELLEINFNDFMNTEMPRVRFYPNGTCDELTLVLLGSENGERRKITLEVVTALVDVQPL